MSAFIHKITRHQINFLVSGVACVYTCFTLWPVSLCEVRNISAQYHCTTYLNMHFVFYICLQFPIRDYIKSGGIGTTMITKARSRVID